MHLLEKSLLFFATASLCLAQTKVQPGEADHSDFHKVRLAAWPSSSYKDVEDAIQVIRQNHPFDGLAKNYDVVPGAGGKIDQCPDCGVSIELISHHPRLAALFRHIKHQYGYQVDPITKTFTILSRSPAYP
jgi:hypothetical protein